MFRKSSLRRPASEPHAGEVLPYEAYSSPTSAPPPPSTSSKSDRTTTNKSHSHSRRFSFLTLFSPSKKGREDAGSVRKVRSFHSLLPWRKNGARTEEDDGSSFAAAVDLEVQSHETATTLAVPAPAVMASAQAAEVLPLNLKPEMLKVHQKLMSNASTRSSASSANSSRRSDGVEVEVEVEAELADFVPTTAASAPQLDLHFDAASDESAAAFVDDVFAKSGDFEEEEEEEAVKPEPLSAPSSPPATPPPPPESPAEAAHRDAFHHKQFNRKHTEQTESWGDIASALRNLDSVASNLPPVLSKKAAPKKPSSASSAPQNKAKDALAKKKSRPASVTGVSTGKKASSANKIDNSFSNDFFQNYHQHQTMQLQQQQQVQYQYQTRQLQQYPPTMYQPQLLQQQQYQQQQQQYQQQRSPTPVYTSSYPMQTLSPLQQQYAESSDEDGEDSRPLRMIAGSSAGSVSNPGKRKSTAQLFADDPELAATLGAIQSLDLLGKSPSELQKAATKKKKKEEKKKKMAVGSGKSKDRKKKHEQQRLSIDLSQNQQQQYSFLQQVGPASGQQVTFPGLNNTMSKSGGRSGSLDQRLLKRHSLAYTPELGSPASPPPSAQLSGVIIERDLELEYNTYRNQQQSQPQPQPQWYMAPPNPPFASTSTRSSSPSNSIYSSHQGPGSSASSTNSSTANNSPKSALKRPGPPKKQFSLQPPPPPPPPQYPIRTASPPITTFNPGYYFGGPSAPTPIIQQPQQQPFNPSQGQFMLPPPQLQQQRHQQPIQNSGQYIPMLMPAPQQGSYFASPQTMMQQQQQQQPQYQQTPQMAPPQMQGQFYGGNIGGYPQAPQQQQQPPPPQQFQYFQQPNQQQHQQQQVSQQPSGPFVRFSNETVRI